ncbi:PREDICTED: interleukin-20 receptor subunit alpha [Gavialis gangeticus]|uniref:interleukin-20 receptor subunit alpha n=1 Tax=Gavialis gangeticus TaxID=94835 RepID=UPI00092FBC3E|nr:PREDICTED: interleukin-20 receptor subunit alpha [Gavialis gangeticus]
MHAWSLFLFLFPAEQYCSLPPPTNIHFESTNMKNVLHWSPPEGVGDGVFYRVKYLVYGENKWVKKSECQHIDRTWCDLSSDTYDHEKQYYASVKAFLERNCSSWAETERFNPLTDTQIDPPAVTVSSTEKSISIVLTAPEKWKRTPEDKSVSLFYIYSVLQYNVSVLNKKTNKKWWFSIKNNTLIVPRLESNTVYCISVQTHVPIPRLFSGFSEESCIATLKDPNAEHAITVVFGYILPIFLTAFVLSMTYYVVHRYIHVSKQKHPANLVLKYTNKCNENVFVPTEKIVVNFITVNIVNENKASQETINLIDRSSRIYYNIHDENRPDNKPPKEELLLKHLVDSSEGVKILPNCKKDGNWPCQGQVGNHCTLGQRNEEVIEYECDVRPADLFSVQKLEDHSVKVKSSALGELLNKPQITLEDLDLDKTKLPYCPQLNERTTDTCSVQILKELKCNTPEELSPETETKLLNLGTEKSGQLSFPHVSTISQGPQDPMVIQDVKKEYEQTILVDWDPHTGKLYISSLSNFENDACEEIFEHEKCDDPAKEGLLSRLYERQVSDEPSEDQEIYLQKFKEQWGLHVKMED